MRFNSRYFKRMVKRLRDEMEKRRPLKAYVNHFVDDEVDIFEDCFPDVPTLNIRTFTSVQALADFKLSSGEWSEEEKQEYLERNGIILLENNSTH